MGGRIPKFLALSYESLSKLEHTFLSSFCSSDSLSVKKGSKSEEGDGMMETEIGVLYFIDRRRDHEPRNASGKEKEKNVSLEPPEGIGTAKTLILAS